MKLEEVKLEEMKLEEVKLEEMKLEEMKLEEMKLEEVKLEEVKLEEVKLEEVTLERRASKVSCQLCMCCYYLFTHEKYDISQYLDMYIRSTVYNITRLMCIAIVIRRPDLHSNDFNKI